MPLAFTNPFLIRSGSYGTRPYGAGTGSSLVQKISEGVGLYIEGYATAPYQTTSISAFIEGRLFTALPNTPAFIRGLQSARTAKQSFISGPVPARQSHSAYIYGHRNLAGSRRLYIQSYEDIKRGSQALFTQAHQPLRSLPQRAYIHPWDILINGHNAFIISIIDSPRGNTRAFIYGISRERFSHSAFIQIETPEASSQPSYVHIETPTEISQGVTIVASEQAYGYKGAYSAGYELVKLSQPSFIQIETPRVISQSAFINGPPIESSIGSYVFAPWVQPSYVHIETPIEIVQRGFTRGHREYLVARLSHLRGSIGVRSSLSSFVQVLTPILETQKAYIVTVEPRTPSHRSFVRGIERERFNQSSYLFGHYITPPSAISAYIRIGEPSVGSTSAFVQIENELYVSQGAFIRGLDELPIRSVRCYMDSRYILSADPQPSYVHIESRMTAPAQRCFIQIETPRESVKRSYIRNVGILQQPNLCYTFGGYITHSTKLAYIHLPTAMISHPQRCFIDWRPSISSSTMCYIFETGIDDYTQICYLNGDWQGAVDVTKTVFINGRSNQAGIHIEGPSAYVSGTIPVMRGSTRSYVVNYGLIGNWKLDDGEYDPGTATAKDSSTVGNDGRAVNWPTWVEGPHRSDCSHD